MKTIGIICEGASDRPIVRHTIVKFCRLNSIEEPDFVPLVPEDNESSGWVRVIDYCKSERLTNACKELDFVVIQIDTDRRVDKGYDVTGNFETIEDEVNAVKAKLISIMPQEVRDNYLDKIVFAISSKTIECWLLPFVSNVPSEQKKSNSCKQVVDTRLGKGKGLNKKEPNTYFNAAKYITSSKSFHQLSLKNPSLKVFVEKELVKLIPEAEQ